MYQRHRVLSLWEQAGLKNSRNRQVREFIDFVEKNPGLGWEAYVNKCRQDYPAAIAELVAPLLASGDQLIVMNVLRLSNFRRRGERDIARRFARDADPGKNAVALELLAKSGTPSIKAELAARGSLPGRIKGMLVEEELAKIERLPGITMVPRTERVIG